MGQTTFIVNDVRFRTGFRAKDIKSQATKRSYAGCNRRRAPGGRTFTDFGINASVTRLS